MTIFWPYDLPDAPLLGAVESVPDLTLRSPTSRGPAKVRRVQTDGPSPFQFDLNLTADQVESLRTFYVTTTAGGSVSFAHRHPRTRTLETTFRFVAKPQWVLLTPSLYRASVQLELLP